MSNRGKQFRRFMGQTVAETAANILAAHSREVKSTGRTRQYDSSTGKRSRPGEKVGFEMKLVPTQLGNKTWKQVPTVLTCSKPMNPAKAQRIAASLHRSKN